MTRGHETSRARTLGRLIGFLKPYWLSLAVSVVLAVAAQFAGMTIPWLTGVAIDQALPSESASELALIVGLVVAFGAIKAGLMLARRLISGRQALAVEYDVRTALYAHLLRLSFRFFDRNQTGQLMSRATVDLQNVRFFLGYGLIFLVQHLLTIVGVTIILLVLDWQLALFALAITPVVMVVAYLYSSTAYPIVKDVQQSLGDVTTVAEESIVGINVVKSFAQETRTDRRFGDQLQSYFRQTVRATRNRALYSPLLGFLPVLAQGTVLIVGGRQVIQGRLSLGEFVAFNVYVLMLVMPLRMLGVWIGQAQRAAGSGERIFEIMDEPQDIQDAADAIPLPGGDGAVRFEGVDFGYHPELPVLRDVNLEIEPGRTVALVGRTGSGKTTLCALLPRFYEPDRGLITLDGCDVSRVQLPSLRSAIGIVSQDPFLFSASIRDNIAFGSATVSDEDVRAAARTAQADAFIEQLPDGYGTTIGERGVTLSGGQRQRVAIARALLIDPRVLILDDATASVDARTEAQIRTALRTLMAGRTTIIIAHRLSTLALADEVVVLDEARVVARGSHDEVVADSEIYREIVEQGGVRLEVAS